MEIHALAHLLASKCSSPVHKRGYKRFKCHSLIRHFSKGESKENFYDAAVKCVEIWLLFDFRSAARLSFCSDFSIPSFSATRVPYLSHIYVYIYTHMRFLSAETLLSWNLPEVEARSSTSQSKCLCQTSGCLCCVDLNLTATIDLGGPACVNIRQKEQNISLNLSYGDNPIHNATIKIGK